MVGWTIVEFVTMRSWALQKGTQRELGENSAGTGKAWDPNNDKQLRHPITAMSF